MSDHDHGREHPIDTKALSEPSGQGFSAQSGGHEHSGHDHEVYEHGAHDHHDHGAHDHSAHDPNVFRRLLWVCIALSIPTLVFSTGLQEILHLPGPRFPGSAWIPAIFGAVVFVIGGRVFLTSAVAELRSRAPGMMTLIALAILVAFGYSLAVVLGLPGMDFWWELATLIDVMLLGHWIEMSAVMGAQNALGELAKLLPDDAERPDGTRVARADLVAGDLVVVRPGAAVPADGEVVEGESEADESLLTGESAAVPKAPGATVVGGSVVRGGALTVRVTRTGDDTALAGIQRLVAEAQASRSGTQLLADKAAAVLFYVALGAAAIALVVWLLLSPDDPAFVLERVVTVLVIACPHALGLAIPLVVQLTTAIGARRGILVRDRAALETARSVDVVLFDKTGTLTAGRPELVGIAVAPGVDESEALGLAAAVEARSEHPLARAIVAAATGRDTAVPESTGFRALEGRGAEAEVAGRALAVVGPRVVTERGVLLDPSLVHAARELGAEGATIVHLLDGDRALAVLALGDAVRPESAAAVDGLHRAGIRVAMLTGDAHRVADAVAARLGIDEVHAEVLPGQKADVVAELQARGAKVAMVGDGVNDAPALARADVGIAIGAGTDVAIASADIVLASDDPRGVLDMVRLSRAAYRKMLQNLVWATAYNVLGIPLAAGVLAGVGFLMPPAVGAAVMSVSTIVVALNAQLLRRMRWSR
ncbi:copper-translocating P-type ATPase [Pseudolysinimonas sp.]|uniref:copper-translocating P-type ATPase n=1 Tax=Pseudolysinimonas sp. TaxID=2680009 RepID=UPI003F7E09BC